MAKQVDFLIIGGSAAGTTAAETIRRLKPEATISIITDEDHEQYSRVLLPHYIRGKVVRDQVFLKKPDWYTEHKIDLVKGQKAKSLDANKKVVGFVNGEEIQYGKLLISIGGFVIPLAVPGSEKFLYMRTVEDADKIIAAAKAAKSAVIIGGGFIGLEFCSCFAVNGVKDITTLVIEKYYWERKLDEASSKVLTNVLERNGIKIKTQEEVDHVEEKTVITKSGNKYPADAIGVGIGIKSDLGWLESSGVKIERAIVTNEFLETSLPDVYAAGDCAEFYDVIFERQHIIGNWANATSQGSTVGKVMAGERVPFETASSYSITFFDGSCTFIGVTEADYADEVVARGSVEENKVTRIFVKKIAEKTRIVGATVINNPADVAPLTMVVKGMNDVVAHVEDLKKADFDLKSLI